MPFGSRYYGTWRFYPEFGCIGYLKQYKFLYGRYRSKRFKGKTEDEKRELLMGGRIKGIKHHSSDDFECPRFCSDDAVTHKFKCPECGDKLLDVKSDDFYRLYSMEDDKFMKKFLRHLL